MRLDNEKPSGNVEDRRGQGGGGFGFPGGGRGGGGRINIPMGGRGGGLSFKTIIFLVAIYFVLKMLFGIDLLQVINGGGLPVPGSDSQITVPGGTDVTGSGGAGTGGTGTADVTGDAGRDFVARVLGSTERIWNAEFSAMGQEYPEPRLVLFTGFVQSACGMAQSAMVRPPSARPEGLYRPVVLSGHEEQARGAGGDTAQAYVIAHEVGHHVQTVLGIADKVMAERMRSSEEKANALSVRMELQADCLAGLWAQKADTTGRILEEGDIEEALNAAAAIGDDRLQKRSQGYVVPEF